MYRLIASFRSCLILLGALLALGSCSALRRASTHGLDSGNYTLRFGSGRPQPVYADVLEDRIDLYPRIGQQLDPNPLMRISLREAEALDAAPVRLRKNSLDIDITTILLKYRPGVSGLQPQLTTDFNMAIYAGWRHDTYTVKRRSDPLGRSSHHLSSWGYDFGFFAGPGSTSITPFTTANRRSEEYSAMIIQTGMAGFIETRAASFGLGIGVDHLMNGDRDVWIYRDKPWIGFLVGIAIN